MASRMLTLAPWAAAWRAMVLPIIPAPPVINTRAPCSVPNPEITHPLWPLYLGNFLFYREKARMRKEKSRIFSGDAAF